MVRSRNHVRRLREARGMTQAALAEAAGISRQSLGAIEAGRSEPSVTVAMRLGRALECPVEEVFAPAGDPISLEAELAESIEGRDSPRLALGHVHGRWVAHPLHRTGPDAHAHAADGIAQPSGRRSSTTRVELLRAPAQARDTILLVGCAPALGILASRMNSTPGTGRLVWLQRSSGAALGALARHHAHVAGVHVLDVKDGNEPNVAAVRQMVPGRGLSLVTLAWWETGLAVPRGNPLGIRQIHDLSRPGLRIATREKSAGARVLLERCLRRAGMKPGRVLQGAVEARGHLEAALAIAVGGADVAVTIHAAALAHGLDFVPVCKERFDLVIPAEELQAPGLQRLLDVMNGIAFRRELEGLGGYDAAECGRVAMELPSA
jgi:putative molybdopterin biosynthesis protein